MTSPNRHSPEYAIGRDYGARHARGEVLPDEPPPDVKPLVGTLDFEAGFEAGARREGLRSDAIWKP
jgi:hypothetical protein